MNITLCKGFKAAGMASGIKKNGDMDLGVIISEMQADVAGVFTKNVVRAACVEYDREIVKNGKCRAIIANSGNANCYTGEKGMEDNQAMAKYIAAGFDIQDDQVIVASTGVIGQKLPIEKIKSAVPELVKSISSDGINDFAKAIMTTDSKPKLVSMCGKVNDNKYTVTGVAKGSGMIRPDMATMLCFVCTDAGIDSSTLASVLKKGADSSFNRITVDGDTSTNDMIILAANGMSGAKIQTAEDKEKFQDIIDAVLLDLAKKVVKDGEGVTKVVQVIVTGAQSNEAAFKVADTISHSNLVKTAFFGEDANWGRIIAAAGRAGINFEPSIVDLKFDNVFMVKNGEYCGPGAEGEATKVLKQDEFGVTLDLKGGSGTAAIITCDFSVDYVKINADYRT